MKKVRFFALAAAAGALFACQKTGNTDNTTAPATKGVPTPVTLSVNFNANAGSSLSRALNGDYEAGSTAENKVSTIEFYVFNSAGAIDPVAGSGTGYIKFTDGILTKQVIVSSGAAQFVALANMNLGPLAAGKSLADLKAMLSVAKFSMTAGSENARTIPTAGFEMSGEASATIVAESVTNSVSIAVSRLVSKFNPPTFTGATLNLSDDQIASVWGAGTTVTNTGLTFNPLGWVVINGLDKSGILFTGNAAGNDTDPKNVAWNTWDATGKSYLLSAFDGTGSYTANYSGYGTSAAGFLNFGTTVNNQDRVYAYENAPVAITVDGQSGYDPQSVYAFIIKGDLIVDGDAANTNGLNRTRYWRVDLVRDNDYHILRNCSYHVNINSISTPGWATPEAAEEAPDIIPTANDTAINITVIVNPWRINEVDDGQM